MISKYNWKLLQEEYNAGASIRDLCKKYNIGYGCFGAARKRGDFVPRSLSEAVKLIDNLNYKNSKLQSDRRKSQIAKEQQLAYKLVEEGYEIYSPTVVCDRIAVKDNKVYFIEFKKQGQKLRSGQKRIQILSPDSYIVVYDAE